MTRENLIELFTSKPNAEVKVEAGLTFISYTSEKYKQPSAICIGTTKKPKWHYAFQNPGYRERKISETVQRENESIIYRERLKEQAKADAQLYQPGLILNTCWGYEQTNVEFFQVTKRIGKATVELREIKTKKEYTGGPLSMQGKASPVKDEFIGEPFTKRINQYGTVKITDSRTCFIWDGVPVGFSEYA